MADGVSIKPITIDDNGKSMLSLKLSYTQKKIK